MKNAILLHGKPSKEGYYNPDRPAQSNAHWFPWLQHQLLLKDILAQTPEMPRPYAPVYEEWREIFEGFLITDETILVGHSCGGGFLIRYLSENKIKVGKVALVAPWIDPQDTMKSDFFDFTFDNFVDRTDGVHVFYSKDDHEDMRITVDTLMEKCPEIILHTFLNKGHFVLRDMETQEFPELRDVLLG